MCCGEERAEASNEARTGESPIVAIAKSSGEVDETKAEETGAMQGTL